MNDVLKALTEIKAEIKGRHVGAQLLSVSEAARRLGVSRTTTLPALIASGNVRIVQLGKRVRIPVSEIERICAEGLTIPTQERKFRVKKVQPAANLDWEVELRKLGV